MMMTAVLTLCLILGVAASAQPGIYGTRQLALDTYAYVDKSGANCGIVITAEGVVVIDTGGSSVYARSLLSAVRDVTSARVRHVVNTHHHHESTLGNCIVGERATIIAHPNAKAALRDKGERMLFEMRSEGAPGLADVTIKLPMRIVARQKDLTTFGKKIVLIPFTACHSPGDLCAWLPEEKLLFCGDLVFSNYMPDLKDSRTENWLSALDALAALQPETVVPAHGVLCDANAIATTKGFLETLRSKVKAAKDSGMPKEEAMEKVDMTEFRELVGYQELVGVAVGTAYDELD